MLLLRQVTARSNRGILLALLLLPLTLLLILLALQLVAIKECVPLLRVVCHDVSLHTELGITERRMHSKITSCVLVPETAPLQSFSAEPDASARLSIHRARARHV
jgi:hypothetical protein